MKKRVMTLIGGIVGTVFDAIFSVIMIIGIAAILDLARGAEGSGLVAVVGIMEIALGVIALILNAISISGFACDHDKYKKRLGVIIAAVVFNFLLAILLIFSLASAVTVITVLVLIASLAANVLYLVDIGLEKKRVEAANAQAGTANAEAKVENQETK